MSFLYMDPQNTRPVTPLVSSDNEDVLLHLSRLMEKQLELLQRMDARQVAADVSKQTIPQAPALSNAAWLPLLKSFRDHIDPVIERARSGLDALLVFIGLFSAIVTAFFVDASKDLEFDPTRRTNALLVNLTEVIVALHRSNGTNLDILYHDTFKPDEGSTRFNLFLSLSLILSLAGAVLAIICRGFLTSLTWSRFRDASRKLTDIHKRWDAAERFLFPMVHALTPSMILPVLLFLVGLLDHLFDLWNSVMHPIISFGTALYFEAGLLIALGLLVAALTLHGILRPGSSPFQSVVSRFILSARAYSQRPRFVSQEQILAFHQAVQHCQDDDLLDQAASSVVEMVKCSEKLLPVTEKEDLTALEASEADMLLHLLSVESSYRTNLTAASVIIERSQFAGDSKSRIYHDLSTSLLTAGRRYTDRLGKDARHNWESPFTKALAKMARVIFLETHSRNLPKYMNALTFMYSDFGKVTNVPPIFILVWLSSSLPSDLRAQTFEYGYRTLLATMHYNIQTQLDWAASKILVASEWDYWVSQWLPGAAGLSGAHKLSSPTLSLIIQSTLFPPANYPNLPFDSVLAANTAIIRWLLDNQDVDSVITTACHEMRLLVTAASPFEANPPDWRPMYAVLREINLWIAARLQGDDVDLKNEPSPTELHHHNVHFMNSLRTVNHTGGPLLTQAVAAIAELTAVSGKHRCPGDLYAMLTSHFAQYVSQWPHATSLEPQYNERGFLLYHLLRHWPDFVGAKLPPPWVRDYNFQKDFILPLPPNWTRMFSPAEFGELGINPSSRIPPSFGDGIQMSHGVPSANGLQCFYLNSVTQITTFTNPLDKADLHSRHGQRL